MIKYEYKKVTGYKEKKFIENGHTMFEDDVLQRLQRLAYLEAELKKDKNICGCGNPSAKHNCENCGGRIVYS